MHNEPITGFSGEKVPADVERAFRRGFHHGAYEVLGAIEQGVPLATVQQYVNHTLHDWRHGERGNPAQVRQKPAPELSSRNETAPPVGKQKDV